ncbi:MAG: methyltransferase [Caldilineaceae bacterium]
MSTASSTIEQPIQDSITPDPIIQLAMGFMASKHLFVANEIGLFRCLAAGSATLDELAQRTNVPRRTLRISADAMVALGLVERQGDRYQNGPVAAAFLSGQGAADFYPLLRFWNRISYPLWCQLEAAIRSGQAPNRHDGGFSAEEQRIFSEGVEAFTLGPAAALVAGYDFSTHRRVLDLGGGTGSILLHILRQYAGLQGTLLELAGPVAVARQRLAQEPESDRIAVVTGDFFKEPLPADHDAIIVANVLHLFLPEQNRLLLQNTRAAVKAGARLLIVDFLTDPTHTQPVGAALAAGEYLVIAGNGDVYSDAEVRGWLQETGWRPIESKPLGGPTSLLVAEAI